MNSGLTSTEMQVIVLKELFTSIISELITLNTELSNTALQAFQKSFDNSAITSQCGSLNFQKTSLDLVDSDSDDSITNQQFKNLINKCMGDVEKAERLIKYECQRYPELDREGAIKAVIVRWENDNR